MISDGKKRHYLALINFSALFKEKLSNHKGDLYCLNCFNSYTTENKLKEHKEICNNHNSYHVEMPKQPEKIFKYIYREKNPEKSYTEKKAIHEPSGWAMSTSFSFDEKENKLNCYRGKDCIKKLCKNLKKCAMKIVNYEKKKRNDTAN